MWQSIKTAPFDRDLKLAVIDTSGVHALVFPCRRVLRGWIKSQTGTPVQVFPSHWREWGEQDRLDIIEEYANDLRAIIKKSRDQ